MRCVNEDRPCPFRALVCRGCECWWNCFWICELSKPPFECPLARDWGGCPYNCIYEALENECPHKPRLKNIIQEHLEVIK